MIDFDYIEKLAGNNNELMLYIVPLLQQFDDWAEQNREAEALAASRKELLRRENTIRFSRGKQCFFCDKYPLLNHKIGSEYEKVYIDNHADDCEWAKELGDD